MVARLVVLLWLATGLSGERGRSPVRGRAGAGQPWGSQGRDWGGSGRPTTRSHLVTQTGPQRSSRQTHRSLTGKKSPSRSTSHRAGGSSGSSKQHERTKSTQSTSNNSVTGQRKERSNKVQRSSSETRSNTGQRKQRSNTSQRSSSTIGSNSGKRSRSDRRQSNRRGRQVDPVKAGIDFSTAVFDEEVGKMCVIKEEEVESVERQKVLECTHKMVEKCHYTYVTIFTPSQEEDCEENFEKKCQITFKLQAYNETVRKCYKPTEKVCNGQGAEECRTVYESSCTTKYVEKQPGKFVGDTGCEKLPVEICGAGCTFEEGEEECHDKTVVSTASVPEEVCDLNPQKTCRLVTKLVPRLKPTHQCTIVPQELCQLKFSTPQQVKKPLITKWCLDDTPATPGQLYQDSQREEPRSSLQALEDPFIGQVIQDIDFADDFSAFEEGLDKNALNSRREEDQRSLKDLEDPFSGQVIQDIDFGDEFSAFEEDLEENDVDSPKEEDQRSLEALEDPFSGQVIQDIDFADEFSSFEEDLLPESFRSFQDLDNSFVPQVIQGSDFDKDIGDFEEQLLDIQDGQAAEPLRQADLVLDVRGDLGTSGNSYRGDQDTQDETITEEDIELTTQPSLDIRDDPDLFNNVQAAPPLAWQKLSLPQLDFGFPQQKLKVPSLDGELSVFSDTPALQIESEAVSDQEHEEIEVERLKNFLADDHSSDVESTDEAEEDNFTTNFTTEPTESELEFETFVDNTFPTQDFSEFVDFQQF